MSLYTRHPASPALPTMVASTLSTSKSKLVKAKGPHKGPA